MGYIWKYVDFIEQSENNTQTLVVVVQIINV